MEQSKLQTILQVIKVKSGKGEGYIAITKEFGPITITKSIYEEVVRDYPHISHKVENVEKRRKEVIVEKGWSIKHNSWVESKQLENRKVWINRVLSSGKRFRSKNRPCFFKCIEVPSVVLTLQELKQRYQNRWLIPVSPEILCRYNGKTYNFQQLKEIW